MARIAGVDIPREKRVDVSLRYIFGIGASAAHEFLEQARLDAGTRGRDLTEPQAAEPKAAPRRRREKRVVPRGAAHVKASFNNTIISLSDPTGNVIAWSSAGAAGWKGSRKSTPYAAQVAAENAVRKALDLGLKTVEVFVRGPGAGREAAIRALEATGLEVTAITDVRPIPHNGCRPR